MTHALTRPGHRRVGLLTAGALVAGAVEIWLAWSSRGPGGILERRYDLLVLIGLWAVAYTVCVVCVLRLPRRTAVVLVLLLAVALRLAAISPKAPLSDDLYRYAWDGRVQVSGTDPYRYPPLAPELTELRTPWLFPADHPKGTQINRPTVRTIYPPVAEAWFAVEHVLLPDSARDRGYEAVGLLLDLAVLAVLLALLRDRRWVALYALAPLPVLEAVQNAHVDVLAVLLTLGAVALAERRRPASAAAVLALAALVKVYPALLLPVLLRGRSALVRGTGAFVAVVVAAYLPHVLAVGTKIFGYLPGYLSEERYDEGGRFLLLGAIGLSGASGEGDRCAAARRPRSLGAAHAPAGAGVGRPAVRRRPARRDTGAALVRAAAARTRHDRASLVGGAAEPRGVPAVLHHGAGRTGTGHRSGGLRRGRGDRPRRDQ